MPELAGQFGVTIEVHGKVGKGNEENIRAPTDLFWL